MKKIPAGVFKRLPIYLSCLVQLQDEGVRTVSSKRIGQLTGVNPAAIRRDLICFGTYGIKGVGYGVGPMIREIKKILGSDHPHKIVLVGAGNLGSAIAYHAGLKNHGFNITAIFDIDPTKIGTTLADIEIRHTDTAPETIKREGIKFAILAVPSAYAQKVTDQLVDGGISVILNYTSMIVRAPTGVRVHNSDPVRGLLVTLHTLSSNDTLASS
jgi:redox-sensing transcriptional repressor